MDQVRRIRLERGLSQARLAALAELDPSTVNMVERGRHAPTGRTLEKLANALGVSVGALFEESALPLAEAPQLADLKPRLRALAENDPNEFKLMLVGSHEYLDLEDYPIPTTKALIAVRKFLTALGVPVGEMSEEEQERARYAVRDAVDEILEESSPFELRRLLRAESKHDEAVEAWYGAWLAERVETGRLSPSEALQRQRQFLEETA